jgi:hypothetical protein
MGAMARERIVRSYDLRAIVGRYDALYSEFLAEYRIRPALARRWLAHS